MNRDSRASTGNPPGNPAGNPPGNPIGTRRLKVWDPWVRLVHWSIVLLIPFSFWTAKTDRWDLHLLAGYTMLTLLLFRIAWGLVGSHTARFRNFLRSPLEAVRHLGHVRRRPAAVEIGHNAAGGWMVLVLLLLLLAQASTGLFANHDVGFTYSQHGPLAMAVSDASSEMATDIHTRVFWAIVAAAVLHILAIIAYRVLRGQNLVKPMITGTLEIPVLYRGPQPRMGHPLLAVALLAAAAAAVWGVIRLG
jgi:cytochrome b